MIAWANQTLCLLISKVGFFLWNWRDRIGRGMSQIWGRGIKYAADMVFTWVASRDFTSGVATSDFRPVEVRLLLVHGSRRQKDKNGTQSFLSQLFHRELTPYAIRQFYGYGLYVGRGV